MSPDSSLNDRLAALLALIPNDQFVDIYALSIKPDVVELYRGKQKRTFSSDLAELDALGLLERNRYGVRRRSALD